MSDVVVNILLGACACFLIVDTAFMLMLIKDWWDNYR